MNTDAGPLPSGTVTFLFTDIEKSTELARRSGPGYAALRSEHRRLLREAFSAHEGHEIDTAGDGFFVVFERAGEAVAAAVAAQRALAALAVPDDMPFRVRMGLHTAEPYVDTEGYVGVGVSRAARICALGSGGQILLSNATAGVVEDLGLEGIGLRDLGEHHLKDMQTPQRLFQLDVHGLASDFPLLGTHGGHVLGTLLATDLYDWSRLFRLLGDDAVDAATFRYHSIVSSAAESNGGRAIEALGDHAIAFFDRPRDAIRAALAVREAIKQEPWISDEHRCPLKCGIHSGRLVSLQPGRLGSAAPYVMGLCETAEPWQILVSHATEALLEGEPPEFRLLPLGERMLPRRDRPERVFAVSD